MLGFRDGQAVAVSPAKCVGHGLCERACPVDAIQLVFGTATRGVHIPRVRENFETNVSGIYVVGELGGMGLIRNAFEQGRQCVEGIGRESTASRPERLDAVVVGCGPAGLSASLHLKRLGLRFLTVEKEDVGGTVRHYPRKKLVMTEPVKVPGFGRIGAREIRKESLIDTWVRIVEEADLPIRIRETVHAVERHGERAFTVVTDQGRYETARVILAIGRRGVPRKLGVPGGIEIDTKFGEP